MLRQHRGEHPEVNIYRVGGSVRDELLGLPVKDRDYVVVGATSEEMVALGYKPVGKDFPVFLHPTTHEEYALARTERKTARGYKGFNVYAAPDVTLEQDLRRRDLTINAMALDGSGQLIDPYGGERDLRAGVLRHVSDAFAEDPVRLLRTARFAARFGFVVAPETQALMSALVASGEVDALVAERVWQELARGLMAARPVAMLDVLASVDALVRVLPQWSGVAQPIARAALQIAASSSSNSGATSAAASSGGKSPSTSLASRYALLLTGSSPAAVETASDRLRVPAECRDMAILLARFGACLLDATPLDASSLVDLLRDTDAFRRPERFIELLDTATILAAAQGVNFDRLRLENARDAARDVDAAAIARAAPENVVDALRQARIARVASRL